jgi:hypothetical protein
VRADAITIREERDNKSPPIEYSLRKDGAPEPKDKAGDGAAKVEVLSSGTEALTIGGKQHACEWRKTRITFPLPKDKKGDPVVITRIRWASKDVPLTGEVRLEVEMDGTTVRWDLTGFGRGAGK